MNVHPKEGGPWSLFCEDCKTWVPDTANAEMRKEGCFSHSHICGHVSPSEISDEQWRKQNWSSLEKEGIAKKADEPKPDLLEMPIVTATPTPQKEYLGPNEREFIFREVLHSYRKQDAEEQIAQFLDYYNLDIDDVGDLFDFDELATMFSNNHDCNIADNDQWQNIIKQYIENHHIDLETAVHEYTVSIHVRGRYLTTVRAISIEQAKERAENNFSEADFAELTDVDGDVYSVETEDGETHYCT